MTAPNKRLGAILTSLPVKTGCGNGDGREAHRHGEVPDRTAPFIFGGEVEIRKALKPKERLAYPREVQFGYSPKPPEHPNGLRSFVRRRTFHVPLGVEDYRIIFDRPLRTSFVPLTRLAGCGRMGTRRL